MTEQAKEPTVSNPVEAVVSGAKLNGKEKWFIATKQGEEVYACDGNGFYPIVFVEMGCGLINTDVCGRIQINYIDDCEIKIGFDGEVLEDNFAH